MEFNIRFAQPRDVEDMMQLINELAVFEKEPEAVEIDAAYLKTHGFGHQPSFQCFVAEDHTNTILGMALFYNRFSTWKGLTYHLEDLIVQKQERHRFALQSLQTGFQAAFDLPRNITRITGINPKFS